MMNISPFYLMNIPVTVGNYKPQLTFIQVGNYLDGLLKMIKMNWKDYWRGLLLFLYSFCLLCYWYIWIIHPIRTEIASPITFWNKNAQFYISECKTGRYFCKLLIFNVYCGAYGTNRVFNQYWYSICYNNPPRKAPTSAPASFLCFSDRNLPCSNGVKIGILS